ncbi:SDR family oxidoreductase [Mycolicibacterium wolinskyi]|uniref:SDR family oxidoreductase n=1 Tax=Mycolicibacterium wolinskyi TaxID=59750 RepID=UPI003917B318
MRVTVVGATGQIGSKVVDLLSAVGHQVVSASRRTGIDVLTGEGLQEALAGAQVLVDVTNSPSFDDEAAMAFFTASSANLTTAAKAAGVGHYVALSIVGADRLPDSGYMRAKVVQEHTITDSGVPYTIVRATQFHEFAEMIVGSLVVGDEIHAPDARIQPIAAADVAAEVAEAAQREPTDAVINIGGPDKMTFADLAEAVTTAHGEQTAILVDPAATYFGTPVDQHSLVTGDDDLDAVITSTRFADYLAAR